MLATCSFWTANLCLVRFRPHRIVPSREEWGNAAVFPRSVPLLLEFVMREARRPLSRSARIDSEVLILGVYGSQSNPINSKWITKQPASFFPHAVPFIQPARALFLHHNYFQVRSALISWWTCVPPTNLRNNGARIIRTVPLGWCSLFFSRTFLLQSWWNLHINSFLSIFKIKCCQHVSVQGFDRPDEIGQSCLNVAA